MLKTTLCYVYQGEKVLMVYRNKKKNDFHEGKWNGLGGKFEASETALECVRREVYEESGLTILNPKLIGVCFFPNFDADDEWMYIYVAHDFTGAVRGCPEGELHWILKDELLNLNVWDSDHIFMPYVLNETFFTGIFNYEGKRLVSYKTEFVNEEKLHDFLTLSDSELERGLLFKENKKGC